MIAPASADTETSIGSAPAQEPAHSTPQDEVQQTEYYPITLKWTWQVIENDRNARYRADLEQASVIISARLAGYYVKAEDLEWAKAIGQKEVERDEAEKVVKKQEQEAKRAGKLPLFSSLSIEYRGLTVYRNHSNSKDSKTSTGNEAREPAFDR